MSAKQCRICNEVKPHTQFALHKGAADGRSTVCKTCKAAEVRERRAGESQAERNAQMAAYRAGMRKDKCAVCGSAISGTGLCESCEAACRALGGASDALKRAAKAWRFLHEQ